MSSALMIWWSGLCAAAAINIAAWVLAAWQLKRLKAGTPADIHAVRVRLLWLAAIYVLGCGFRSVFPMLDVPRICLHDTWISRIIIGRSVATLAELSFAAQLALLLRVASVAPGGGIAAVASRLVVPFVLLAELFCWTAVLRENYLMHAFENSLWTLMAVLASAAFLALRLRAVDQRRGFFGLAIACATGYVAYMVFVDVPMYVSRWHTDLATHHQYLSLSAGFAEILQRCTVMREWSAWRHDVPWLSLYFTVAVWISIALVHAPLGGASRVTNSDVRGNGKRRTAPARGAGLG
jgi:hypothetical protein